MTGVREITAQTHQVCQNLQAAVGTLADISRVDVDVRIMEEFDAIHAVRRQYSTGVASARRWSRCRSSPARGHLIEIGAIAVVDWASDPRLTPSDGRLQTARLESPDRLA